MMIGGKRLAVGWISALSMVPCVVCLGDLSTLSGGCV